MLTTALHMNVHIIEIGGLECALYCFAFVWYVIPMGSKDGSNTLAKDCCGVCRQMLFSIFLG